MSAFFSRFVALGSYRCYERRVLLDLAAFRNGLVALGSLGMLDWQAPIVGAGAAILLAPCNGVLLALVSADFVERAGRILALGYADNVNVSARCELEGANTPTKREHEAEWRHWMFKPLWPDDPGPGHYLYPIPTFWGRVRALWS